MMGAKLTDARASGGYPAEAISDRRPRKCFGFRTLNRLFFQIYPLAVFGI